MTDIGLVVGLVTEDAARSKELLSHSIDTGEGVMVMMPNGETFDMTIEEVHAP